MSATTPPGWFPDQTDHTRLRWWDGQRWTEHTRPLNPTGPGPVPPSSGPGPGPVPPGPDRPSGAPVYAATVTPGNSPNTDAAKPWYLRWWAITSAVVVALALLGALLPGDGDEPARSGTTAGAGTSGGADTADEDAEPVDSDGDGVPDDEDFKPDDPKVQTQDDVDTDGDGVPDYQDDFPKNAKWAKDSDGDGVADPVDAFPKDPEFSKDSDGDGTADPVDAFPRDPSKAKITLAMENALESAQDYLDYSAFSRQGLIDQLSSEYGEGYDVADATWAVDRIDVDWKEEAVEAAKDYLDYSSFSRQGLIEQLSSRYGSQFSVEEATYAVNKIGL